MVVEKRMPPLSQEPRRAPHECDVRVEGAFGPGTVFSCDVCGKRWIYRPTDLALGKFATWPWGALIRINLIWAIIGFGLIGNGMGWRKVWEFIFTSVLNWSFWLLLVIGFALDTSGYY